MKMPCCSVCHTRYDEGERVPLVLDCGHGFCKACLTRMFSASADTTLSCPRCRRLTTVGNSVHAIRKNFTVLSLLSASPSSPSFECDLSDDDTDGHHDDEDDFVGAQQLPQRSLANGGDASTSASASASCCSPIDLGSHHDLRLLKRLSEGSERAGQETWLAVLSSSHASVRKCEHRVAVKRIAITEDMDVVGVQSKLENLQRASMWCRNVCTFHGAVRMDAHLCLVMDRYNGSILAEMRQNKGRLTLEQILRYGADIARGVAELHAAGVVCMNLKPSNLLLDENCRAVVSDYGLLEILKKPSCRRARSALEESSSKMHSCMDCTMLSPHYTAPEAWEPIKKSLNLFWDDTIGSISEESDAWSFGCTLVEMCTGSVPWAGLSSDEIYRAVVKARSLPPQYASVVGVGIPRELWKMIGECLQFKASKRPTFHAMLGIFLRHLQGIPRSPPASPDNDIANVPATNATEASPTSVLEVVPENPSVLHQLVSAGDVSGVRDFLAKAGRSSNSVCLLLEAQDAEGHTALHLACKRGSVELVETILEYKEADVNMLDKDGEPPIVFALAAGSPECVRALISRSANISYRLKEGSGGQSVAHYCALHGQPDCMRELLLAGADPNAVDDEGESVLHTAIAKKYTECAIVILENGGCISMGILNAQRKTPLHLCIESWNVALVKRWVEVASQEEIYEAIDIPSPIGTALCMAAALKKEHEIEGRELVRILLAAGADPTAQDEYCRTPLHAAAMVNDAELVKIILDAGVDVDVRNSQNTTPLHVALNRGANLCVGLLLSAGANCNLQDDDGDNAFHIAADAAKLIRENLNWIVVMLQYPSPDVEVRNHRGWTLLDFLESLPREWISEELMEALASKGVHLSPTMYEVGDWVKDWVKFRRSVNTPVYGWQGARQDSVGFVQTVLDDNSLIVSFCTGEARVLPNEVIKVIPLNRGQQVQLKPNVKEPRYGWRGQSRDSIGTVLCVDDDGILRVGFPGASRGWRADPAEMERVEAFKVGDWVRIRQSLSSAIHGLEAVTPGSAGIVYSIRPDSRLLLGLCYLPSPLQCEPEDVEPVEPFRVGDQVCVKRSVAEPRYAWGGETHHSVGKISEIESNGLLVIDIPNRSSPWKADPSDMEKVENFKVGNWVKVKASVPSPKYGWEDVTRNSIGVIHSLEDDGDMGVAFCFRSKPFCCSVADMERVPPFEVGQRIHVMTSIAQPRLGWSNETSATIGTISRIDMDGTLNVKVAGRSTLWKVAPGDAEPLSGLEVGDWVRLKPISLGGGRPTYDWNSNGKESIAVVHSIQDSGFLELAGCSRKGRWMAHCMDVEKVPCFKIGQHVRFRPGLLEPRWGWRDARPESRGIITGVHADGEVRVAFSGMPGIWRGDPADLEEEEMFDVGEWVRLRGTADAWRSLKAGSIGVVHGIGYSEEDVWDGTIHVSFCGEQERWVGVAAQLERVDKLVIGQRVRIKKCVKQPRFGWSGHTHGSVGTISSIDADGKLRIFTPAGPKTWMMDPAEVDRVEVEEDVGVGDWVRVRASVTTPTYQWGDVSPSSIGVVHKKEDGELWVAFCFMGRLWVCEDAREILNFARAQAQKQAPNLHHPLVCIDVIEEGIVSGPHAGLWKEAHAFEELINSDTCKSLVHVFFAIRATSKVPGITDLGLMPRKIAKVAILGGGLMGSGIATALILSNYPVILKEVNEKFLNAGIDRVKANLQSRVKKGKMTEEKYKKTLSLLTGALDYGSFKDVDMVIEAVIEKVSLKQEIFADLEKYCSPHCILSSNTSTIDLNLIGDKTKSQDRIVGAHFFSPAHIMPLLEVVRTQKTSPQVVVDLLDVGKKIRKTPIVVGNCTGFAVNRMFFPYTQSALLFVDHGLDVYKIDRACTQFGMPMGPFRVADLVGFGVAVATGMQYLENFPERCYKSMLMLIMQEDKRAGEATRKGFYLYDEKKRARPDTEIQKYIEKSRNMAGITPNPELMKLPDKDIVEMVFFPVVNEACRVLDEGIAVKASDLDVASIMGMGFPPYRGGIMFWADTLGAKHICRRLEEWTESYSECFKPCAYLAERAANGTPLSAPSAHANPHARL